MTAINIDDLPNLCVLTRKAEKYNCHMYFPLQVTFLFVAPILARTCTLPHIHSLSSLSLSSLSALEATGGKLN
jgi:hypothetical protein